MQAGAVGQQKRARHLKRKTFGHGNDLILLGQHLLGKAAPDGQRNHLVADLDPLHAFTDGHHLASGLAAG